MLEFQHITKRFGKKTALNDVSFIAEDGKVTGFWALTALVNLLPCVVC